MAEKEIINEQWKYSEFKNTVVDIYDYYTECYTIFSKHINNRYGDKGKARNNFISAMATLYGDQRVHFLPFIFKKTLPFKVNLYDRLLFDNQNISDETLNLMYFELTDWCNSFGPKALSTELDVYSNNIEAALSEFFNQTTKTKGTSKYGDLQPIYNFMYSMLEDPNYGIKKRNQDCLFIVSGKTGTGKSRFLMQLFQNWYTEILKVDDYSTNYLDYFAPNSDEYINGLHKLKNKKWHIICNDEATDSIKRRNHMTKKNREISQLFDIMRGLNLIHGLAIPDFSDVEKGYVKQRIDFVIVLVNQGDNYYAKFYSRHRCRELHEDCIKNSRAPEDSKILPNFSCKVPLYDGILVNEYEKRKQQGIEISIPEPKQKASDYRLDKGKEMYELIEKQGKGYMDAYKELDVDNITGKTYLKLYCKANNLSLPKKKSKKK